ncbi:MAG: copper resistance protein B, partial [Desulfuromonadales bacterium]
EYELMLTQRLILIPRLESHVSFQDLPEYEEWEGITDLTAGARLTYQIRRKLAPYIGVSWTRLLGETANRIEGRGGDVDSAAFIAGVRFWF